jgi:opacity protein-like surface antigen
MRGWLAVVLLACLSVSALAQDEPSHRWRVELGGGAIVPLSNIHTEDISFARLGVNDSPDSGGTYSLGVGYSPLDYLEALVRFQHYMPSYNPTRYNCVIHGAPCQGYVNSASLRVFSLSAGVRVRPLPPTARVRPWVGADVGWYRGDVSMQIGSLDHHVGVVGASPPRTQIDDGVGGSVGGGVDVRVIEHLSVGVDVRYHNAPNVLGGFAFVTTLATLSVLF